MSSRGTESAETLKPQDPTVDLIEACAKVLKAAYAAERRFLEKPSETTFRAHQEAIEHYQVLRDQCRVVERVRRAAMAAQLAEFSEDLLQKLDERDAKEHGDGK